MSTRSYSREYLISAFLSRYVSLPTDKFAALHELAETWYDQVGKDEFRRNCALDSEALKVFNASEWHAKI